MQDRSKTPAEQALDALKQAYAYYDAPKPTKSTGPEPHYYYEYLKAA